MTEVKKPGSAMQGVEGRRLTVGSDLESSRGQQKTCKV